jgi:aminotransferase
MNRVNVLSAYLAFIIAFSLCGAPEISHVVEHSVPAASIKYNNLIYDLKMSGTKIIALTYGEAYFDIPLFSFEPIPYPALYHYSHSRGIIELRQKLSEYYQKCYAVIVNPDTEIMVTAGSKSALHFSLMSVLNPGDEVLIPEPAWVSYPEQTKLCYAKPVCIPYWKTIYEYEQYITTKTKVIIVNNPCNPSGKVYSKDELVYLVQLAKKHDIYILADEAYSDFLLDDTFYSIGLFDQDKSNVILCNSLSKNYGMSGWRIGYVITNAVLLNQILKVNQHLMTCPATVLEYYIAHYFDEILAITYPQIKSIIETRREIGLFMDLIGLRYFPGTATFYFFVSIAPSKLSSEEFCTILLTEKHIGVVPGSGYGKSCDAFIRISVGTESKEAIKYALKEIKSLIECTS